MPDRRASRKFGFGWLRAQFAFVPNQIVVGLAVRAVLAIALPLLAFRLTGLPMAGLLIALGALQVTLGDGAGPYRARLFGIGFLCLVLPAVYLFGVRVGGLWWLAALGMFVLAFAAGMMRGLGTMGVPLGLTVGATYLFATRMVAPTSVALVHTGWFFAGCLWTLTLTLAAWRLRPYVALQREVGSAVAVAASLLEAASVGKDVDLAAQALVVRTAIESARKSLGVTHNMAPAANPVVAHLYALLYLPSRLAVQALDLAQLRRRLAQESEVRAALDAAGAALARGTAAVARAVIESRTWQEESGITRCTERLAAVPLTDSALEGVRALAVETLRAGVARLHEAAATCRFLARARKRGLIAAGWPELRPREGLRALAQLLRAQLSPRSTILHYALRIAVLTGVATAIEVYARFPHGMWLPLTVLVVMQPDFGATRARALVRTGGTLAGVIVAGIILVMVPWTLGRELAVAVLVFLTTFTLRLRYGLFVACLTPLVIILLALYSPNESWNFVLERASLTVAGAALAIIGAFVLWPTWVRRRLPDEFAQALSCLGRYLQGAFATAARGEAPGQPLLDARREAELAVTNAEAAFQTMLAEPRRRAREVARYLQLSVQLKRLVSRLGVLVARLEAGLAPVPALAPLGESWAARLGAVAELVAGAKRVAEWPPIEPVPALSASGDVPLLVADIGDEVAELMEVAQPDWREDAHGVSGPMLNAAATFR